MTSDLMKCGLPEKTVSTLKTLFSRHSKINAVILYGSRAKGNFRDGSDIDLTLIAPKMNLAELLKIENEIEELLLSYKVDLSLFHQIENPDLLDHIRRVGIKL